MFNQWRCKKYGHKWYPPRKDASGYFVWDCRRCGHVEMRSADV